MTGVSFAGEIRDRGGLDRHAGFAGHDGEGAARFHHGDHLRPFRRVGLHLEGVTRLDWKPGLLARLGQKHDRAWIGILGKVHSNIGIRIPPEDMGRIAVEPHFAIRRLEAQRPQTALDGVGPSVERQGGRNSDEQKSRSKDGGRNLHQWENLFLRLRPEHCTANDCITYVLIAGMSTGDRTTVAEGWHHAR